MKPISTLSAIMVATLLITSATSCRSQKDLASKVKKLEVNDVFHKVYSATQEAIFAAKGDSLKIDGIDLTFATTTTDEENVGIKLWVISGAYSRSNSVGKSVTFSFAEDTETAKSRNTDPQIAKFKNYLISVIKASREINAIGKFGLKEFEVSVDFTVSHSGEVGAEIEILPVTPSLSGKIGKEISHTVTVKFSKSKEASSPQLAGQQQNGSENPKGN